MRQIVLVGAFAIFWFLALFTVLPIRLGGPDAAHAHRIGFKFALATGAAVVLWGVFYGLVLARVIEL